MSCWVGRLRKVIYKAAVKVQVNGKLLFHSIPLSSTLVKAIIEPVSYLGEEAMSER